MHTCMYMYNIYIYTYIYIYIYIHIIKLLYLYGHYLHYYIIFIYIYIYIHIYGNKVDIYGYMYVQYRYISVHIYMILNRICMHICISSSVIFFQILGEVPGFWRLSCFCSIKFFTGLIFVDLLFNVTKYSGRYQSSMMEQFAKILNSF